MFRRSLLALSAACVLALNPRPVTAQNPAPSIVGVWTLNKDLSDQPPTPPEGGDSEGRGRGRGGRGPGGSGGGPGGGGFGGGFGGGRGGRSGGGGRDNMDEMLRRMEAMRDIMAAPERLNIVRTESMVIVTAGDGRTTRLATDGSKVKDESTGIERKTRWDGERLVTEISGGGVGKVVETYALDPESQRLTVTLQPEGNAKDGSARDNARRDGAPPRPGPKPRRSVYDRQQP